jgi:hypothetical protein
MATLNFPSNPTVGQIYEHPEAGPYEWNGFAWQRPGDNTYVNVAGDTMTGPLVVPDVTAALARLTGDAFVGDDALVNLKDFRTQLRATSGYQKLAGGVFIQWGGVIVPGGETVTLPIAFPNQMLSLATSLAGGEVNYTVSSSNLTNASFRLNAFVAPTSASATVAVYYIAIGY